MGAGRWREGDWRDRRLCLAGGLVFVGAEYVLTESREQELGSCYIADKVSFGLLVELGIRWSEMPGRDFGYAIGGT